MSHAVEMEFKPESLELLERACQKVGFTYCQGKSTIRTLHNDTAAERGFKHDQVAVIEVPGVPWDIGVQEVEGKHRLVGDEYMTKWVNQVADQYHVEAALVYAEEMGYEATIETQPDGAIEVVMVQYE